MPGGKKTRATLRNYTIVAVMLAAAASILLADRYWHSEEAFMASYTILWFGLMSGIAVVVSGKYRTNRKPWYIRDVIASLIGLLGVLVIFAFLTTVTMDSSAGLTFVAMAGATGAGIIIIKLNTMLLDEYEKGKAAATQPGSALSA